MDDRIKQIIGRFKHKTSVDTNTTTNVDLESSTRVLKTNANVINSVIGLDEQFDLERDQSNLYRFLGRINVITANELTQGGYYGNTYIPGTTNNDWDILFDGPQSLSPNNWVIQMCYPSEIDDTYPLWGTNRSVSNGLLIKNITNNNPNGNRSLVVLTTIQKHKLQSGDYIHINDITGNGELQGLHKVFEVGNGGSDLEYSITLNTTYQQTMVISSLMFVKRFFNPSNDDILYNNSGVVTQLTSTDFSGTTTSSEYTLIKTNMEHNLSINNYVDLRTTLVDDVKGLHRVVNVIDTYSFIIKHKLTNVPGQSFTPTGLNYRLTNGTPSDYYVRIFEVLTTNECETNKAGYSTSIYPDTGTKTLGIGNDTWLFQFTKDINTDSLISHRGGVVTQLQMCILKRSGQNTYDWSNVTSHWDFNSRLANTINGLETVSIRRPSLVGSIQKNSRGSKYIGDISEFNREEILEKTITEVIFRFGINSGYVNTSSGPLVVADPNGEGYYYKPFKSIDIRKFSNTIDRGDETDTIDGLPADYEEYGDGTKAWRRLLPHGIIQLGINGVDWPFMNGRHYVYLNHHVYVRRQIPINQIDQSGIISITPRNVC